MLESIPCKVDQEFELIYISKSRYKRDSTYSDVLHYLTQVLNNIQLSNRISIRDEKVPLLWCVVLCVVCLVFRSVFRSVLTECMGKGNALLEMEKEEQRSGLTLW